LGRFEITLLSPKLDPSYHEVDGTWGLLCTGEFFLFESLIYFHFTWVPMGIYFTVHIIYCPSQSLISPEITYHKIGIACFWETFKLKLLIKKKSNSFVILILIKPLQ
jgi:hypothetical protein